MQSRWLRLIGVAVVCLGFASLPAISRAQSTPAQVGTPVSASGKGAIGLGLVGAELGAVIPALAGVDATWAYIVFPVVGAAGGAVAGYFAIDKPDHAELSVVALTVGMTLIIPALVITLSETAYDAESDTAAMPRTLASTRAVQPRRQHVISPEARARAARAAAGSGLLRLADGELALAAPGFAILPSVQRGDTRLAGVSLSLLSGRF
jgi:hypothetical protein